MNKTSKQVHLSVGMVRPHWLCCQSQPVVPHSASKLYFCPLLPQCFYMFLSLSEWFICANISTSAPHSLRFPKLLVIRSSSLSLSLLHGSYHPFFPSTITPLLSLCLSFLHQLLLCLEVRGEALITTDYSDCMCVWCHIFSVSMYVYVCACPAVVVFSSCWRGMWWFIVTHNFSCTKASTSVQLLAAESAVIDWSWLDSDSPLNGALWLHNLTTLYSLHQMSVLALFIAPLSPQLLTVCVSVCLSLSNTQINTQGSWTKLLCYAVCLVNNNFEMCYERHPYDEMLCLFMEGRFNSSFALHGL